MKAKIMDAMQKFSRAMFIPVLILPIAGILIALGNLLTNARLLQALPFLDNPITTSFGTILSGSLVTILVNLGLIFCVGISVGLAKDKKGEAGFTGLLAFLVFLNAMNRTLNLRGMLIEAESLSGTGQAQVLGVQVLDMGVFAGILLGLIVAYIFNRFSNKEFNNAFNIYGGTRFAFIVTIPVVVLFAVAMTYIWSSFQYGINQLGGYIKASGNFGLFIYGALERLLIPTGLHHLVYTPFLYSSLGGVETIAGQVYEGSRNIYFAEMLEPTITRLSESVIWDARGISKMFGLIGACLAMYHTASPEKKVRAKAILIPAAFTSFIAGVTEPIEFSFMFVAPILFLIHAALSGLSMVTLNLFNVRAIGPNGFIDFLLMNLPLGIQKTSWPMYIIVGLLYFVIYYLLFRFIILKFDLPTIGREKGEQETRLYSKKDYLAKVNQDKNGSDNLENTTGEVILASIGGPNNIVSIDNCYTRLRLILKDSSVVDKDRLINETNANGVVIKDENVHIVYGLQVTNMRKALEDALKVKG